MLRGSEVNTQQVHQTSRDGGPATMHPEHADDTRSRPLRWFVPIGSMRQVAVRHLRLDRPF